MSLYDKFTREQKTVPKHVFDGRRKSFKRFPKLNRKVRYTGTYYDGAMPSPERIAIEVLRDGLDASPYAWAANYVRMARVEDDRVYLVDEINGESFFVEPDLVINATGPWIDFTNLDLGAKTNFIGGTKGSHLVLDHPELLKAIDGHEFFFENNDGRIVLIFPLEDKVMIGTSDIRVDDPDKVVCTEEEVDYFFEMVGRVFPDIKLNRSHIVYKFSGVRPLPYSEAGSTGQISRDHQVDVLPPGEVGRFPVYSLVGGKWTSFRAFSEVVTDMALDYLGRERTESTEDQKIGGSKGLPTNPETLKGYKMSVLSKFGTSPTLVERLVERYGTLAEEILQEQGMISPAGYWSLDGYSPEEIAYLARSEDILHLDDLILRRTMIGKLGLLDYGILVELAEVVARVKGWSDDYKKDEIVHTLHTFEDWHGVRIRPTVIG
jgi:glycerol-3-phosphate dehydrogenase